MKWIAIALVAVGIAAGSTTGQNHSTGYALVATSTTNPMAMGLYNRGSVQTLVGTAQPSFQRFAFIGQWSQRADQSINLSCVFLYPPKRLFGAFVTVLVIVATAIAIFTGPRLRKSLDTIKLRVLFSLTYSISFLVFSVSRFLT